MFSIDVVLQYYSQGCDYILVADEAKPFFNGTWIANYVPGPGGEPEPSYEAMVALGQALIDEGATITLDQALSAYASFMLSDLGRKLEPVLRSNTDYYTLFDMAERAILLALVVRSTDILNIGKSRWLDFTTLVNANMATLNITQEEIDSFNAGVTALGLPAWLQV